MKPRYDFKTSHAFVEIFSLKTYQEGPLSGLKFAVKDIVDIQGHFTSFGNPTWRDNHPKPSVHALCVDQLLAAGAECIGKTVTDEYVFSLIGENFFYGTPLNPKAPDRVPGGSSSGSASAVACGLVDFALGTDTGGSVRIPASNCGVFGLRPSHGVISVAGVLPFAPTFDTVGVLSASASVLTQVGSVLLGSSRETADKVGDIYLLKEAWEVADAEVQDVLNSVLQKLKKKFSWSLRSSTLSKITSVSGEMGEWRRLYCLLQWAEIWNTLGSWLETHHPKMGPRTKKNFELTKGVDRTQLGKAVIQREAIFRDLHGLIGENDLICLPTAPTPAPLKGSVGVDRSHDPYYARTLALTSIAGLGRLPQVTLPLANVNGIPIGLSFIARHGQDAFLLAMAERVEEALKYSFMGRRS